MKSGAIWYKDTWAVPGSDLHRLLSEAANEKDPKVAKELREKAKQCYDDCLARHKRCIGELSFHGWAPK